MRIALISLFFAACGNTPPVEEHEAPSALYDVERPEGYPADAGTMQTQPLTEAPVADDPADAPATAKVNVNIADEATLKGIPGVTERMAHEFEEYRPYVSISQFRTEIGKYVDEATVAGYEQHIYVPIQINDCDAATLMQVPGLDAATAEQLIAARPFASKDEFTTMLEAIGSNDAAHAAMSMLAE